MAHGDTGAIEVVSSRHLPEEGAIELQLVLTYTNDGDRAEGATVTARVGDGAPVTLQRASAPGAYVGTLTGLPPGPWTVTIEAMEPSARLELTVVPETTTTTIATTTTTAEVRTTTTAAEDGDEGGDSSAVPTIGLLVVVAIGAAIGFRLSRRSRS